MELNKLEMEKQYNIEEITRKEEKEKQRLIKLYENSKKHEEYKKRVGNSIQMDQNRRNELQKELEKRENDRKENIDYRKNKSQITLIEKQHKTEELRQNALEAASKNYNKKKEKIELKLNELEEHRKNLEADQHHLKFEHEILKQKKEKDYLDVIKRNEELLQKRLDTIKKDKLLTEERQRERGIELQRVNKEKQI